MMTCAPRRTARPKVTIGILRLLALLLGERSPALNFQPVAELAAQRFCVVASANCCGGRDVDPQALEISEVDGAADRYRDLADHGSIHSRDRRASVMGEKSPACSRSAS